MDSSEDAAICRVEIVKQLKSDIALFVFIISIIVVITLRSFLLLWRLELLRLGKKILCPSTERTHLE